MNTAAIPMKVVGPINITSREITGEVNVPIATFETPLWPSITRGAKVSRLVKEGIRAVVVDDRMTRSVIVEAPNAERAVEIVNLLALQEKEMQRVISTTSRFAELEDFHFQIVGNLIYLRFEFFTGDASGHNMATKAADALINWLLSKNADLKYVSISGNYCTDKKCSAVNGILGRGKYVVTEILIPQGVCEKVLRTTPEKVVELNIKKNLIGTMLAGSIRSANAHFANMLLGFYLATGQDAANIIEGSQGMVHAEVRNKDLYFSATLPNVIVGTIGNGKDLPFVQENLRSMGCLDEGIPGENGRKLAVIAAATVLCGELSLLAAQTNPGELIKSHVAIERKKAK